MPEAVQYTILRSDEQLNAFEPEWNALWLKDPQATPFQRSQWLLPWWHQFGTSELRAVLITDDDRAIGFVPFYRYREPETGENKLLLLGVGTTDYLDGLFSHECSPQHVRSALELLLQLNDWDSLYVGQLRPQSPLVQAFQALELPLGARFESDACSRMPALSLPELPVKIRRNAMYYRNRAERLGRLQLETASANNWAEHFAVLERLHSTRWQSGGESGVLSDSRVLAWHREALPLLEAAGALRLSILRLDDEPIAALYSLIDSAERPLRTQYFYITAYSVEHADLRPGTLLIALASEQAQLEGVTSIDMLRGNEPYKKIWHLERTPTFGFQIKAHSGRMRAAAG